MKYTVEKLRESLRGTEVYKNFQSQQHWRVTNVKNFTKNNNWDKMTGNSIKIIWLEILKIFYASKLRERLWNCWWKWDEEMMNRGWGNIKMKEEILKLIGERNKLEDDNNLKLIEGSQEPFNLKPSIICMEK